MTTSTEQTPSPQSFADSITADNLAEVYSTLLLGIVWHTPYFLNYGLSTKGKPWYRMTPLLDQSVGCVLPQDATYTISQASSNSPWNTGQFVVSTNSDGQINVTFPDGSQSLMTSADNVLSGTLTLNSQNARVSLTSDGSTLFGAVIYQNTGDLPASTQTIGVYAAEAPPPAEG